MLPIPFSPKSSQARPYLGSPRSGAHYRDQRVDHMSRRTRSVIAATPGRCLPPASAQDRNQGQSFQGSMLSSPPTWCSPLLQPLSASRWEKSSPLQPASTLGLQQAQMRGGGGRAALCVAAQVRRHGDKVRFHKALARVRGHQT